MPSKRKPLPISSRAYLYADGQVRTGGHAVYDRIGLETGWRAGYRAALRDVRKARADGPWAVDELLKPRRG